MPPETNPFAALTLIAAPAVLTNASSVLVMSTSNRLGRVVDRVRVVSSELEAEGRYDRAEIAVRLRELAASEQRMFLLLRALRCFYLALGGFAGAALLSLAGAVLAASGTRLITTALEAVAVVAGLVAVGGLVTGCALLLRETRIAVDVLHQSAEHLRARVIRRHGRTIEREEPAEAA